VLRAALAHRAPIAAILGALAISLGSLIAAVAYTGSAGQSYDPRNHFVSELGERGVSELAIAFNLGVIVGGLGFAMFMLGLARVRTGRLRYGYGVVGVLAGVSGILVGVFPMDTLAQHRVAAAGFFNLGWIAIVLASVDIAVRPEPRFPRWLAALGAATVTAFLAFIYVFTTDPLASVNRFGPPDPRPDTWIVTILEWLVIIMLLGWTAAASVTWIRAGRRSAA